METIGVMRGLNLLQTFMGRWFGLLLLVLIAFLWAIAPAASIEIQTGETLEVQADQVIEGPWYGAGDRITIDGTIEGSAFVAGEEITIDGRIEEDLYVAGDVITVNGTVQGDVFAAGRIVNLNGTVGEDATLAARAIALNGDIGDDVRMAAQVMLLTVGRIADDVVAAGFSLEQKPNSIIEGSLTFGGQQALLAGTIEQDVVGGMGAIALSGTVRQDVHVAVESTQRLHLPMIPAPIDSPEVPPGLTLAESATIGGSLSYQSNAEASLHPETEVAGEVTANIRESSPIDFPSPEEILFEQLRRFLALLLVGWLLLRIRPNWIQDLARIIQTRPLPSLGWGLVALIAILGIAIACSLLTVILTLLLGITLAPLAFPILGLGGLTVSALLFAFLVFSLFVPPITLSFWGGQQLLQRTRPSLTRQSFIPLILGLFLLILLTTIPILGGLLSVIVLLLGLGSFWLWTKARYFSQDL